MVVIEKSALGSSRKKDRKRHMSSSMATDDEWDEEEAYCVCGQASYGQMIACDNEDCEIEWFHLECVGLTQVPSEKWFCPLCRKK